MIHQNYTPKVENLFYKYDYNTKRLYYNKYHSNFSYSTADTKIYNKNNYFVTPQNTSANIYNIDYPQNLSLNNGKLLVNYIYLDNEERDMFRNTKHEYLIDLVEFQGHDIFYSNNFKVKSGFTQLSKEIFITSSFKNIQTGNWKLQTEN